MVNSKNLSITVLGKHLMIFMLVVISKYVYAQCYGTENQPITFTTTFATSHPDSSVVFILTDYQGSILESNTAQSFSAKPKGKYRIFGARYRTIGGTPGISVGNSVYSLHRSLYFVQSLQSILLCPDANTACNTFDGNFSFVGTNGNAGLTTTYVLTNYADEILALSSTPSFQNIPTGYFLIYAINHETISGLQVGQNINNIIGACFDISNPIIIRSCDNCIASVTGNNTICVGQSTTLTATGGNSYFWSNNETTSSVTVSPSTTTTYTVTVTQPGQSNSNLIRNLLGFNASNFSYINSTNSYGDAASLFNNIDELSGSSFHATRNINGLTWGISYNTGGLALINNVGINRRNDCCTDRGEGGVIQIWRNGVMVYQSNTLSGTGNDILYATPAPNNIIGDQIRYVFLNGINNGANDATLNFTEWIIGGTKLCQTTGSLTVTVNPNPTPAISGLQTICAGQSATFTASGGTSYLWNTGATSPSIIVNTAGIYSVTATNNFGCSASASATLTINPNPTAIITGNNFVCNGGTTTLTASGGTSYLWSNAATTAAITVGTGTYTVTVTDVNGCTSTASRTITNTTVTAAIAGNNFECNGGTTTITASGGTSYLWSNAATTAAITVGTGTYTVTVTGTNGCTSTASRTITNTTVTAAIAGNNFVCNGGTTTLTASGGTSYLWSNAATTAAITVGAGTYTVTVTGTNGCTSTASRTITNTTVTAAIAGDNFVCNGGTTILTASGGSSYLWSNAATTAAITVGAGTYIVTVTGNNGCTSTATQTITNTTVTAAIAGNNFECNGGTTTITASGGTSYLWSNAATTAVITVGAGTYTVTVTGNNGCISTATQTITNTTVTALITGDNFVCNGGTTTITASGGSSYLWSNAATTAAITVGVGTYSVTVTGTNGCTSTASRTINNTTVTAAIAGDNFVCNGGTTTITASGGTSYLWSNAATTAVITVGVGTYTVTVTGTNGCTSTASRTITNTTVTAAIAGDNFVCNGGTTTLTASGGTSYLWSNAANTAAITVGAGTYTVTVTGNNGCTSTATQTITNTTVTASITGDNFVCNGGTTTIKASGGTAYLWSNAATTAAITVGVGTYTVTITGTNGCTSTASRTITNTTVTASITGDNFVCNGGTTTLTASGGTSYLWSNTATTAAITVSAGNYTVTVTGNNGCTSTATQTITNTTVTASITGDNFVCNGGTTTITASGGTSYLWSNAATTAAITVGVGTFTVTVTGTNGCTSTATQTITNTTVTAAIAGDNFVCNGGTTILTASGGSSYLWSNAATTAAINIGAGTYTVTVTGNNGCTSTATQTITNTTVTASITGDNFVCNGGTTTITASGGTSYLWSNAATTAVITVGAGTYTVTVTGNNGCTSTASRTITNTTVTAAIAGDNFVCNGGTTILTASGGSSYLWSNAATTAAITVGVGTYTVTVTGTNGCTSTATQTITNTTVTAAIAGNNFVCNGGTTTITASGGTTYLWSNAATTAAITVGVGTYTVTVTGNNGCTSTTSQTITNTTVTASITGDNFVCNGGTTTLTASGGTSYLWSNAATTAAITVGAGTYTITVTGNNGCTSTTSQTITNTTVTADIAGDNFVCNGGTTTLTASGGTSYLWSNAATTAVITVGVGTYTVTVSGTNGCTSTATQTITNTTVTASITGDNFVCNGGTTTLAASGGTSYLWSNAATTAAITVGVGTYTVTVSGTNGCTSTATQTITNTTVTASITGDNFVCNGGTTTLTASGGTAYLWSNAATTAAINVGSGTYTVTVTGTNGCTSTASQTITNTTVTAAIAGNNFVCNGGTTILTASGGTSYLWSNAATTAAITVGVGTYTVTVTSTNGCTSTATQTITNTTVTASITGDNFVCNGGTTTITASGGTSYLWSNAATTAAITVGTGTYTVTVSGTNGCTSTTSQTITNTTVTALITGDNFVCNGGTTTITASGGTSYLWSNAATTAAITVGVGTYTVTVTGNNGCTSTATQTITNTTVTAAIAGDNFVCNGSATTLAASGGTSYLWSNAATTAAITVGAGTYTVTVTGANGCTSTASQIIILYNTPQATISGTTTICKGQNTILTAGGGGNYLWSNGSADASVTVSPMISSLFQVTVTNSNNCTAIATQWITVIELPVITEISALCIGGTAQLQPSTDGVWSSSNPTVATISNDGLVTGLSVGSTLFSFTDTSTGCTAVSSQNCEIIEGSSITLSGPSQICVGQISQLHSNMSGNWTSVTPGIATIDQNGVVTGISQGLAEFFHTNTNGCTSENNITIVVNGLPPAIILNNSTICPGSTTQMLPVGNGIWTSSNSNIASINNQGVVLGISPGQATFIFTDNDSGCSSEASAPVTVLNRPLVQISGSDSICPGNTSQLIPSSGGSWQSLNPTVASISTSGLVTGLTNGTAQFIFTSFATGCVSMPSDSLEILARPLIQNVGDNELCPGETSLFTSNISGTWSSSNPAVASINGAGLLTAHQNGISVIGFTSSQGCVSSNNITVTVFQNPVISLSGPGSLCPGNQSQVNPSTGGVWTSNNPGIALVSNAGVVTAVSPGVAMIYFTETNSGCTSASQLTITVQQRPAVSITGPNTLCIGNTTQLSPSSGGTWQSLQPGVASVSNNGVVTGISGGTATFRYTSSSGCISDATLPVTVNGKPSINLGGPPSICMGQARQLQPSTGGTWMSSNPSVASVTTNGMVSANFKGNVRFVYTSSGTGCPSDSSAILTINELPNITVIGPPQICKGSTTQLSPTTGGVWTSLTSSTAFISNTGMVIGLNQGTALFQFTQTSTGCTSATPLSIQINPDPVVGFVEDNEICSGTQTNLFPSTGGTWKSNHPDIATVTTDGMVTGISEGFATFTFTNSSGCKGTTTNLFVHNVPVPYVNGPLNMCPGGSTQLQPSQGGIWTSSDQNIAVIDNSGLVTAINPGDVFFIFTDTTTSCISEPMGEFSVFPTPNIDLTGDSLICMNQYSFISANIPGVWLSQNEMIATITNDGMILGKAPGKTGFTFMGSGTGCTYETDDDAISVIQCVDPDFNVTFNNVQVSGNISINDDSPYEMSYGNPMTISKPLQSQEQFLLSPNGQYVFTANKSGKYVYNIPACPPGQISGCPNNYLEITVVNPDQPFTLVTNPDFSYVVENTGQLTAPGYSMYATENDKCAGRIPCHTTNHMVEVIPNATNGITSISQNKIIRFVPQLFYLGQEAIDYKFCEVAGSESCSQSKHFITIQHQNANNSTVASDDFFTAIPGDTISGNVMINDQDPQGDILEIQPIGSPQSMISEPFGSYYLTSDGALFMVVSPDFFGPASITYTLCDQGTPATCTNATIYFLVSGHMTLNIRAYLEGALMNNNNAKTPDGRPLMRDNLRNNPFNNQNYIPVTDPYSIPTNNFDISSNFEHKGCGTLTVFKTILDPENVFSVSGQNAIVDWIFVELRSKNNPGLILATRSGLLQRDGDITDLDGISGLSFPGVAEDSVIVVLKHRNHLGLMSLKMPVDKIIDLTSNTTPVFNYGNTYNALYDFSGLSANQEIAPGYRAMWAGDFDGDGKIKFSNPNDDGNILYYELLTYPENTTYLANYDFAYGYYQGDFDLNGKVKFDNPNDDRNYLLIQLLVYPLNVSIQSNFDFFIEQVIPGQ